VLQQYNAKATFFLISDRVRGLEALVSQIVGNGHELGNHLTREEPSINLTPEQFEAALVEADSILSKYGKARWVRPGSGFYNSAMLRTIQKYYLRCTLGSIYPYDTIISSSWFAAKHIMANIRPGAIIILHDSETRGERTRDVLQQVIPELQSRGYRLVTLSELLDESQQYRNPG
jgi:peptidoglycan/xylan/chitin deacetylase (PgdA/CDA1 family)